MNAVSVSGLRVELAGSGKEIVDEIALEIPPGEIAGLVGESGSGKTTVAMALLGHAKRGTRIATGSVHIGKTNVLALGPEALRRARGRLVSYVPQDPSSALNPSLRIGAQLEEVMSEHDEQGAANDVAVAENVVQAFANHCCADDEQCDD